jgi:hypothetical protein
MSHHHAAPLSHSFFYGAAGEDETTFRMGFCMGMMRLKEKPRAPIVHAELRFKCCWAFVRSLVRQRTIQEVCVLARSARRDRGTNHRR